MKNNHSIPMTFDKSHIVTLGRRMYKESINLIRELVNNSYDADATRVDIELTQNKISVSDDGSGMNLDDLHNYFKIGSQVKKSLKVTPKYQRKIIGEIGIGKFSSLGASNKFELITKKGNFKSRIIFDQDEFQKSLDNWEVPFELLKPKIDEPDGTKVILYDIEQQFTPQEIADRLRTSVPLDAKNFEVYINGKKIDPVFIKGKRTSISIECQFGQISGQLIISDKALPFTEIGIVCTVKGVMINRSLFGFEDYGHGSRRITGKINADFLDFTSDRSDFLINTPQYKEFYKLMREEVKKLIHQLKSKEDEKKIMQSRRALSKATQLLRKTFQKLPEYLKEMKVAVSKSHSGISDEEDVLSSSWRMKKDKTQETKTKTNPGKKHYNIAHITPATESKVLKNIRTDLGFNFGFVNEGENGPPSYYYGDTIYVNRQHSLYIRNAKNIDDETRHLVQILIAEAIMLTNPADLRQYYERQIEVLTVAYSS